MTTFHTYLRFQLAMRAFLFISALAISISLKASHIVGGDIYYNCIGKFDGAYKYEIFITIYRDCFSTGAAYDDPLILAIYPEGSTNWDQIAYIPFTGSVVLPIELNNPCGTAPSNLCVERAIYSTIIVLPPRSGGYNITYQRCCRGPAVNNLISPEDTGLTLTTHIPGSETGAFVNSSPHYKNYPPLLLCSNDQLVFDHSATDPDGDVLVYSLVTPLAGADPNSPAPNPPPAPPYAPVVWSSAFGATAPLGPGSSTLINANTGLLTCSPQMLGIFVVGVRVQEYRNGVLIGQTVRDFLFKVLNCNIKLSAILPLQEQLSSFKSYCQGLTVNFENKSYGGSVYKWDFGVGGTTTDVSNQFAPSFTYPAPGTYNATLVVNPGEACSDTARMLVKVNNPFTVSFQTKDSVCVKGNSFDFYGQTTGANATSYAWNFGPHASVTSATTKNVMGVTFNTSGTIPINIEAKNEYCNASYTSDIVIFPEPLASIDIEDGYECKGLTVTFGNSSSGINSSAWDFGLSGSVDDTSSLYTPTFTFPKAGTYHVTLIGGSTGACVDTSKAIITVNELLSVYFTHNDSLCLTDNSFWFDGIMTGPISTQFQWDFGSDATPAVSSAPDVSGVVFDSSGIHMITLKAWFDNCYAYATDRIFIYSVPEIDFTVVPGPRCVPAIVQFQNLSRADSPMDFTWTFGDGDSSIATNPFHVYENTGSYSVVLKLSTSEGCVDTLFLLKQDLITIHSSPQANFSVDKLVTDICNAHIQFTDESVGATSYYYSFDDSGSESSERSPSHVYQRGGTRYPMQVVTNEYGCKDTSYQKLTIEPFSIYLPNAFTPDGNQFNNQFNGVFGLEVYAWELSLYDKWGELIYQSNDPKVGWDGTFKGKLAQDGIYTYLLRYISCNQMEEWQTLTGHVNLLR